MYKFNVIRNSIFLAAVFGIICSKALISQAGLNINIDVGTPVVQPPPPPPDYIVPAPPPPAYQQPSPPPEVVVQTEPQFVYDSAIGMYIAAGVPYDLFYNGREYFYHFEGRWYQGPYYTGPWTFVERRYVPQVFFQIRIEDIRHHRDREYERFQREGDRYNGRVFHPEPRLGRGLEDRLQEHRVGPGKIENWQEQLHDYRKTGVQTVPKAVDQKGTLQNQVPQKIAPQKPAQKTIAPQKVSPKTTAPQKVAPKTSVPQKPVVQKTTAPQKPAQKTIAPQNAVPQKEEPQKPATEKEVPHKEPSQ